MRARGASEVRARLPDRLLHLLPAPSLSSGTWHYYDLYQLVGLPEVVAFIRSDAFPRICADVHKFSVEAPGRVAALNGTDNGGESTRRGLRCWESVQVSMSSPSSAAESPRRFHRLCSSER